MTDQLQEVSAQVIVDDLTGELNHARQGQFGTFTFDKARKMRKDVVISLARRVAMSATLLSSWTVEADEEWEWLRQFIEDEMLPIRTHLLRAILGGIMDFGWKAFEKVFEYCESTEYSSLDEYGDAVPMTLLCLDRVRPLKNDVTWARYHKFTGRFLGLSHLDQYNGQKVYIDAPHSLFINFDEEGLGEYGEADLATAEPHYDSWEDCNNAAKRYDRKMAGAFMTVKYKVGKTDYKGAKTDRSVIAGDVIKVMQSSGAVAIPIEESKINVSGNQGAWDEQWKIEFLNAGGVAADFSTRLMYLDKLKARSVKVTERSVFEGEFGTKADAASHSDAMLLIHHQRHVSIVELLNWHLVNQLCVANAGPEAEGAVKLVAHELSDKNRALFMQIFEALLSDPGKGVEMMERIDGEEVMKSLEIPLSQNNELNMMPEPNAIGDDWRDDIFSATGTQTETEAIAQTPWWAPDVQFGNTFENTNSDATEQASGGGAQKKKRRTRLRDAALMNQARLGTAPAFVHLSDEDDEGDYSCVMAMLPESFRGAVAKLQDRIDKKDLVETEDEPHITVKYGLLTQNPMDVQAVIGNSSPVKFQLMNLQVFSNGKEDVLYADVWSDCLHKLNAKIVGKLPFVDDHAVYRPHMTIAYLKPGAGKRYEGLADLQGLEVILDEVVFSDANRRYNVIKLAGDPGQTAAGLALAFCPGAGPADNSCSSSEGGGTSDKTYPRSTHLIEDRNLRVTYNPTYNDLQNQIKKSKEGEVRAYVDWHTGDAVTWDAYYATHREIGKDLGTQKFAGYRNFDKSTTESGWFDWLKSTREFVGKLF